MMERRAKKNSFYHGKTQSPNSEIESLKKQSESEKNKNWLSERWAFLF